MGLGPKMAFMLRVYQMTARTPKTRSTIAKRFGPA
jgi:hypothetical protein